jgi:hypothetical protein
MRLFVLILRVKINWKENIDFGLEADSALKLDFRVSLAPDVPYGLITSILIILICERNC